MSPSAAALIPFSEVSHSLEQRGNILGRTNVFKGHGQEFVPGITILAYGGHVDGEKAQCFPVKDPSRVRIVLKQLPVPLLALLEHFSGPLALRNIARNSIDSFLPGDGYCIPQ